MPSIKVLIVDDEPSLLIGLKRVLELHGFQCFTASSFRQATEILENEGLFDLALVDLRLPDGSGVSFMQKAKQLQTGLEVIILTGFASVETAVEATKKGAYHFITKPFKIEEVVTLAQRAVALKNLVKENETLKRELTQSYNFSNIIGQSVGISHVLNLVEKVSDSDSTILITGESGTGKELIARALHYNSPRANKPFIPVNCGAIPADLLESELFGHVKGAFTGAVHNRQGRFELANGGSLFLDEIGDLNLTLQVKLLRVLQERRFEPVGGSKTLEVDVRIITATNINLEQAVKEGRFREDLFYRLNVIPIQLPSLRERKTDIELLLLHFIEKHNKSKNRSLNGITPQALNCLVNYRWPGNIRELENLTERIAILKGEGQIDTEDLPEFMRGPSQLGEVDLNFDIPDDGMDFNSAVDSYENALILRALEKTGWNRNQAALLLKLNRTTLVEKIKKKGLRPPDNDCGN